ncbi:molybdate transport system substrate-binding protein [Actimicrobium sp. GrIS 1.19]|uniref:molybdate ABC transporter substrate-binding protein n=1 Tax=Actimicrobium sp. GrIS 1.19 TaxID=3071708 RepID=UPI002DFAD00B|nr:molybdate transport system substrate-binding protein [Actimicrobium sp. GrIS 1.19]
MNSSAWVRGLLASALLLLAAVSATAAPALQIAAAADLAICINELNATFAKANGNADVRSSIGSSGNFFAQINNGAPFDVFLSADLDYPRKLAEAGFADASSLTTYAIGRLVLWSSDPTLDLDRGFRVFADARVQHIAIANPELAPYGRAARAALQHASAWDGIASRLVIGDNVAQAAQFIATGNAQVGLVGAAHVSATKGGRAWIVPPDWYPVIEQGGIVTASGRSNPLAAKYLAFLRSDGGRDILRRYGFALPDRTP